MHTIKVGIREFRTHLPQYLLEAGQPVAVTRHGITIGYFIPSLNPAPTDDLVALKTAAATLDALLKSQGTPEDVLVEEFRQLRSGKTK